MEKKPTVFPVSSKSDADIKKSEKLKEFEKEKIEVSNQIYDSARPDNTPEGHVDAIEIMRLRTETQLKLRDAALNNNAEQTKKYHEQSEKIMTYTPIPQESVEAVNEAYKTDVEYTPKFKTDSSKYMSESKNTQKVPEKPKEIEEPKGNDVVNSYIDNISQPDFNTAFDIIPMPSGGLIYKNKKAAFRVAYMTAADEDILTSPNLLASGKFLEILINRKLLEQHIRYRDLHVGDRNAIMLWLRATSYGHMYPIMLLDENDNTFETEVNLNELKTKPLGATPDAEGLFTIVLSMTKSEVKFKLLSVNDIDEIQELVDADKATGSPLNKTNTYKLKRHIVEVNGNRDRAAINNFVDSMRIGDSTEFRNYSDKIESGIELNISVRTPGGGTVNTFLPLNVNFFWPNLGL